MANNPINLALRFILELAALAAMITWGWRTHTGLPRILWTIALPVVAAALWGTFRVNGDPRESPVPVAGFVRLILEAAFFGTAIACWYGAQLPRYGLIFAVVMILHYAISYDRILWLLKQNPWAK